MFKVHKFRRIVKIPHIYTTYPIFQNNVENSAHSKNTITHRIYILLYVQSTHFKKKKKKKTIKTLHFQCTQFFKKCQNFYTFNEHCYSKNLHYFVCLKYLRYAGNCFFSLFFVSKNNLLFLRLKNLFSNPKWTENNNCSQNSICEGN